MEQNIDDFFKKKVENIQDTLPENTVFDENLLWANIQQDLRKPKRFAWYWLAPVAACLVALIGWWMVNGRDVSHTSIAVVHKKTINTPIIAAKKMKEKHIKPQKFEQKHALSIRKLDFQVENIVSKSINFSDKNIKLMPDSIAFQSNIVFEKKAKVNFKVVHINEISKYDDAPFKQPRFKVQFAGTLFEKTEPNTIEKIKTPSIRIQ